jgi:hypothetical protein
MQTKEGPFALFAMAIANDRITRFVRDNDLPIIMIGFGDCTGGSQASFVTHPLVHTHYFSGTNMPFAGRVVVPSFLPSQSIVSNYLSQRDGAMHGLVQHPFAERLDDMLRNIDPTIPVPDESVEQVIDRVFEDSYVPPARAAESEDARDGRRLMKPVKRVLIHARGCTAVKLTRIAKRRNTRVVLVQSDPDMDSVAEPGWSDAGRELPQCNQRLRNRQAGRRRCPPPRHRVPVGERGIRALVSKPGDQFRRPVRKKHGGHG